MARIALPGRELEIEYEQRGAPVRGDVVLVMGLGMQLLAWPTAFVDALVAAGFRVTLFDNRDAGLSGSGRIAPHAPVERAMFAHLMRRRFVPPYTVQDMADDTIALADALGVGAFHVVGVSLGGMIAQRVAATTPARVLSLTSVMSHAGSRGAPWPRFSLLPVFLRPPPRDTDFAAKLRHFTRLFQALAVLRDGDPELPAIRARLENSLRRAYNPAGTARQLLAITADEDRSDALACIRCPVLVLHGAADPLVPVRAAETLRRALPQARVEIVPGLGHYLPTPFVPRLTSSVLAHLEGVRPS
jgi:pimeloyl-ACP methyl ester carboxylesterase